MPIARIGSKCRQLFCLNKGVRGQAPGSLHKACSADILASINQSAERNWVMCHVKHISQWFLTVHCQEQYTYGDGSLPCETCALNKCL